MCIFLYPPGYSSFNLRRTVRAYVMILLIYHVGEWVVLHLVFFVEMLLLFVLLKASGRPLRRQQVPMPRQTWP